MNPIDGPIKMVRQDASLGGLSIGQFFLQLTFRGCYYNDALEQVAYLFDKVIRCIQGMSVSIGYSSYITIVCKINVSER